MTARPLTGLAYHTALSGVARKGFQWRLQQSREIIAALLSHHCAAPFVSFSCGKDSSVLAHLVTVISGGNVPLRFMSSGETRLLHDVDTILAWFRALGAPTEEICIDRVFADAWRDATWDEQRRAGRGDLQHLNATPYDCVLMGLRREESAARARSLASHTTPGLPRYTYRYRAGTLRCCPLAEWRTEDIGTYCAWQQIPLLEAYHHEGLQARTTARLTGDAVRHYALTFLHRRDPASCRRLLARFPELRSAL